jgi:hypothetical protein
MLGQLSTKLYLSHLGKITISLLSWAKNKISEHGQGTFPTVLSINGFEISAKSLQEATWR